MKVKIPALIAALAALAFCLIPLVSVIKSVKLQKNGIRVESTVSEVHRTSTKNPFHTVTVSFNTTDGNQVTGKAYSRQNLSAGDKVMIWYDKTDPQKIDFGNTVGYNMRGVIIGGLLFFLLFFVFVRSASADNANNKLIRSGMKITAEFVSVDRNEKYRMGEHNPWFIKCKWIDSRNNREYQFVSKDYTIDPAPYLNGRYHIDVYIDPANPGKYYMDTTFMPKGNNTIG